MATTSNIFNFNVLEGIIPSSGFLYFMQNNQQYTQQWIAGDEPFRLVGTPVEVKSVMPPVIKQAKKPPRLDCIHRGEQVGERECPSCNGKISLKVFACDLHKQTTIARQVDDLACCATCDDYEGKE